MRFHHQLWDHHLISDFDLGELEPFTAEGNPKGLLRVTRTPQADWTTPPADALVNYSAAGELIVLSWKTPEGYAARFLGICTFRIQPAEMCIQYLREPGASDAIIAEVVLDVAIPRLLTFEPGYLALHSGAVLIDGHAVAFMGPSGRGKSTLTTWFASHGFPLLTDDCLLLRYDAGTQQWHAHPSHRSVRLWPDSAEALQVPKAALNTLAGGEKRRVRRNSNFNYVSAGVPLGACFTLLAPSAAADLGAPVVRRLPVNDAFIALAQFVLRVDTKNPDINRREFDALTSVTDSVPVCSLAYQRRYDLLPEVQKAIMEAVKPIGIRIDVP
jgi:hypothetical protein